MQDDLYYLGIKALIQNSTGDILILEVSPKLIKTLSGFDGRQLWDLPGGRTHRGETPQKALLREVKDEIGISSLHQVKHLCTVVSNLRIKSASFDIGLVIQVYNCFIDSSSVIALNGENISYKWAAPTEAAAVLSSKYPPELTTVIANLK